MFARLFEMVSTRVCWACIPVAAISSARIWILLCSRRRSVRAPWRRESGARSDHADGLAHAFVFRVQEVLAHFIGALHFGHARDLPDRVDIAAFDEALEETGLLGRNERLVGGEKSVLAPRQAGCVNDGHQTDPADRLP